MTGCTHAGTQFSHPQQEPVAQSAQMRLGSSHPPAALHGGAHSCVAQMQISPLSQASFSSQRFGPIGAQAAVQFLQPGQLDVAQP